MTPKIFLMLLLATVPGPAVFAQASDDEQRLVQILASSASPREKDAACQKLKVIGTVRCVPALAALLTDEQLSHSARYVLESMALPEAGRALLDALESFHATETPIHRSTETPIIGIISSLGMRGEVRAVPSLARLIRSQDQQVAIASARALGQIGQGDAAKVLRETASKSQGALHTAAVDGLFRCANRLVFSGQGSKAADIYERVLRSEKDPTLRIAAYRGMIRASGSRGLNAVLRGIAGQPGPEQMASLQMAREIQARGATEGLTRLLPRLADPVQASLVHALQQRGDPAAASALAALASTAAPQSRLAIIEALGQLGSDSVVPLLAQYAASGNPPEQAAARLALVELHRGQVAETLVSQIATSGPEVQAELARALGQRGDRSALPKLFDLARKGSPSARKSSVKALGMLVDEANLGRLVQQVLEAPDPAGRSEAAEALNYACQRLTATQEKVDLKPLARGASAGSAEARIVLLPVCSTVIDPSARLVIRTALQDPNPEVQAAAKRALCDSVDPELIEDIVNLARSSKEETFRRLAIAGGVRLLTQEETVRLSRGQRIALLRSLLQAATRPEEKRLVLAGFGQMPDRDALREVEVLLAEEALRGEAARAVMQIAVALPAEQAQESIRALQQALATAPDDSLRQALQAALNQIQANADFITDWLVAGPFKQEGKDYAALFDAVFAPETENTRGVEWRPLPGGGDPKRPYVMDLYKALGGQQCVAYARTWVRCTKPVNALLELGSDDGVKVWLNDKQVHAINVARPLQPGSEKVNLALNEGWNVLLLKVTQNNLGWEFCARLLQPDGSHLDGIQVEAAPKTTSAATP